MTDSDVVAWTKRLIAIDTTSRDSNLPLIELVETELARLGVGSRRVPSADGRKANLVATVPAADGAVTGGVVLSGHTDVVPVDGQEWTLDPFGPTVRDGRLYGRGAADMKGFIGVVLSRLPALTSAALTEPVHLALSYDEETGCRGAYDLAPVLGALDPRPRACIVGEPTSLRVVPGHKSITQLRLTFEGRAAHSSLTPNGVNAVVFAARAVTAIGELAERMAADGPQDPAYVVPWTTISVNMINGGTANNIVPARCEVELDFRTVTPEGPAAVVEEITTVLTALDAEMKALDPQSGCRSAVVADVVGLDAAPSGPAAELATALGGISSTDKVTYGTEAGIFAAAGIDTVVCGPGDIAQAHVADEYVAVADLEAYGQMIDRLVELLGRGTVR